ncbi:MAG: sensor histidine kinase, partial [Planctomycetota bacterium]
MKADSVSNQLRWVILLLAAAVILPTVCLLWFMNQAVQNERLAVRQKLIDAYQKRAITFFEDNLNTAWKLNIDRIQSHTSAIENYPKLFINSATDKAYCGLVIYDNDQQVVWPVRQEISSEPEDTLFETAYQLEYETGDLESALEAYLKISEENVAIETRFAADFGRIRCLRKLKRTQEAILLARQQLAYPSNKDYLRLEHSANVIRARILLANLYKETNNPNLFELLRRLPEDIRHASTIYVPDDIAIWGLTKMIEIAQESTFETKLNGAIEEAIKSAEKAISVRKTSLKVMDAYKSPQKLLPLDTVRRLDTEQQLYGQVIQNSDYTILLIIDKEYLIDFLLTATFNDWNDNNVYCLIKDDKDQIIIGNETNRAKPFLSTALGKYMSDFKADLYFRDETDFEAAAKRQESVYLWTGFLVALLVLSAGVVSIRSVNQQIKMNRLKNDFIATVTHELKTPLASMRLLVDTLLEGNYEGEKTKTEYLELVANENKRLTHLIDSFLTFSRMERNKQVFEMAKVSPVEAANAAIDALGPKFESGEVSFNLNVCKPLPMMHADKDGIVTVLVNLLDNAYKYTNSDKQIELNVYQQNSDICFAVKDNGIGLSP